MTGDVQRNADMLRDAINELWANGEIRHYLGSNKAQHEALGALDALLEEVGRLRQQRDEALERVRARHDDVRKASERAEQAYRERDEARQQLDTLTQALDKIARLKPDAFHWREENQQRLAIALETARAALAVVREGGR